MQSTLRIIGGKWRSRKIKFVPLKGVRPTTDATRETLFNWLVPHIVGANCLDLFTGSGALGFEALSRDAKHVVMVDMSAKVIQQLKVNARLLEARNVDFYRLNIPERLDKIPAQPFNIVFLDPPFGSDLIKPTCEKLEALGYLAKDALIYIEVEKNLAIENVLPKNWQILREKTFGSAKIFLLCCK